MIQMQNLQSSMTDTVFASSGKSDKMTSGTEGSSFMDILSSVSSSSEAPGAESTGSGTSDTKSRSVDPDNARSSGREDSSEKDKVSKDKTGEDSGEKETRGPVSENDQDLQAEAAAGSVMTSELLAMMGARNADQALQTEEASAVAAGIITGKADVETVQTAAADPGEVMITADGAEVLSQKAEKTDAGAEIIAEVPDQDKGQAVRSSAADRNTAAGADQTEGSVAGSKTELRTEVHTGRQDTDQRNGSESADGEDASVFVRTDVQQRPVMAEETVQVKVSEGAQLGSHVAEQTADTIIARISGGTQEFEMTLTPESLGKVVIKIVFEEGKAQIHMTAAEPAAQKALNMNAAAVKQLIEDATGFETSVNVDGQDSKFGSYEDQRNEQEQKESDNKESEKSENDENDTISFIQQLRLGLVGDEEKAI